jgi:hypothetical protein
MDEFYVVARWIPGGISPFIDLDAVFDAAAPNERYVPLLRPSFVQSSSFAASLYPRTHEVLLTRSWLFTRVYLRLRLYSLKIKRPGTILHLWCVAKR